jgi:uncharacterized protein (TIGR02145 family)
MSMIKTVLTGLSVVSLCMADISGIVTDTGGKTPLSGAVVKLEAGGLTATTGTDGRFTLVFKTAILPTNNSLPNTLSARISNTVLNLTVAERAAVEIGVFSLTGKALSTVRTTLDAGTHALALPLRRSGVHVYTIKSANREIILKGTAIDGAASGCAVSSQGSTAHLLAKRAVSATELNDVITVTKADYLKYREMVTNSDTTGIAIKMVASAGTIKDIDGNEYQTVKIGNQVWMAENLRVTKYNDGSAIPFVEDSATWAKMHQQNMTNQTFCYFNNMTDADSIKKYGALYTWNAANLANGKKIGPAGWHLPYLRDWDNLQNYLISQGCNWDGTTTGNKMAKALAAKTDWKPDGTTGTIGCDLSKNNKSGFSAIPTGHRGNDGAFLAHGENTMWCVAGGNTTEDGYSRGLFNNVDYLTIFGYYHYKGNGYSVRLLKD